MIDEAYLNRTEWLKKSISTAAKVRLKPQIPELI